MSNEYANGNKPPLIINKKTLVPLGILILILATVIGVVTYVLAVEQQVKINTIHTQDDTVHSTFQDHYETLFTRNEGVELTNDVKQMRQQLNEMDKKLDVIISHHEEIR